MGKAADILVRELFKLKPGETFVITADTESDPRVVDATARAAFAVGAKPMGIWLASPLGVGKAADPMLPIESLTGALMGADAWVEFNNQWLLYSTPYEIVMKENKRLRYENLVGMDANMMVRLIGRVDYPVRLTIEKGKVVNIDGGTQAREFESWLASFNDPQMYQVAHACWGFHPGAKLTGNVVEDERVWGATEWGLGNIGSCVIAPDGIPAASHTDGICLNTSAWLDGKQMLGEGKIVDEELAILAKKLGKA